MTERKNARSAAATAEQAERKSAEATFLQKEFTMNPAANQGVARFLLCGERNAISSEDLTVIAGYRNDRALRKAVERAQFDGIPILSSIRGYFLPDADKVYGMQEANRFVRKMEARQASNRRTVRAAKLYIKAASQAEIDGQEVLPLE